jgi:hypothetical protein
MPTALLRINSFRTEGNHSGILLVAGKANLKRKRLQIDYVIPLRTGFRPFNPVFRGPTEETLRQHAKSAHKKPTLAQKLWVCSNCNMPTGNNSV